jgi:hypothetical protein
VRLKWALDLGLIWAWAPENRLRGPIGPCASLIDTGVSRRLESNRPRFPSLWCRVRVGTPRSADPAQPRWHSTGSCPSWQSGKQESGEADGALLLLIQGTRSRPGGIGTLARTSAIPSGVA